MNSYFITTRTKDRPKQFINNGVVLTAPCTTTAAPNDNSFVCLFCCTHYAEVFELCRSRTTNSKVSSRAVDELFALPSDLSLL